ncbi:MAG: DUF4410 domain-containing protein [Methylobacter sp.]|uniref:DUF4410 domain-containing protein n=1 Tax=Methylobacter sp. TaxID=2051955 RepID=UPI00258CB13F|nr:DUF4410 domain-containing protein [Methylobacter sp.]MCL7419851.1 DUF4410 domain-containing protein [Methylobacter sp.]
MALNTGCQSRGTDSRSLLGAVEIRDEQIKDTRPADLPGTVYVSDFTLEAQRIEGDHGILPEGRLGPIGQRLPNPLSPTDPEARAREIVDTMSRSLVKRLRDKGFAARRLSGPQATMPRDGWLLQGIFTEVDEGNRIKRAVIGFGRGATRMNVQVGVSDLTSAEPQTPFIVFGTIKDPQKTPGAVATVNPYVAAAKFVMEKNATQKDIEATAEQIVDEILNYTHKFREQTGTNKPAE